MQTPKQQFTIGTYKSDLPAQQEIAILNPKRRNQVDFDSKIIKKHTQQRYS
jgi:hypothetical protein